MKFVDDLDSILMGFGPNNNEWTVTCPYCGTQDIFYIERVNTSDMHIIKYWCAPENTKGCGRAYMVALTLVTLPIGRAVDKEE
jgi:hypothetical protein